MNLRVALSMLIVSGCANDLVLLRSGEDAGVSDVAVVDSSVPDASVPDASIVSTLGAGSIAAATNHTCAALVQGVACWGSDEFGQVGGGGGGITPATLLTSRSIVEAHGHGDFTCVVDESRNVWCFGHNDKGQLGLGDRVDRAEPAQVVLPGPVDELSCSYETCCARIATELYCWGLNRENIFGDGDVPSGGEEGVPTPTKVTDIPWASIGVGQQHMGAISTDGTLYMWGRNSDRQLGVATARTQESRPIQVDERKWRLVRAGQSYSCGITTDDDLYCWGSAASLLTDAVVEEPMLFASDVDTVALDTFHTCFSRSGVLYCWGRNDEGQLGTGDTDTRSTPERVTAYDDWIDIAVGRFHTCGRRANGSVWCTGVNREGQVGIDTSRVRAFTRVIDADLE